MPAIDVFNGDADGLCSLHQLRLAEPRPHARPVTGVKRDIRLLDRITDVRDTDITVLDISLDRNREALNTLLAHGNRILYIDHHFHGEIPESPLLTTHIDPDPLICTSLIVDRLLEGRFTAWAVVGAFGDNLDEPARAAAAGLGLSDQDLDDLRECGILLNYNGYGARVSDLHCPPDQLLTHLAPFADPLDFCRNAPILKTLRRGYRDDMARALAMVPIHDGQDGRIFRLPGESWARRVAGVFANTLAREQPAQAHALLVPHDDQSLMVSVRAPLNNRQGADQLCRRFPTGGGRAAAAGINRLPADQQTAFITAFSDQFTPVPQ